eukprot:TRINITY_DN117_c0_g1_i4.p1 TRINITY_DN117_c0_g1~~TRINITY_DN117_c0_g1_i4.p1  ORF type:complete len:511 (+),score=31.47 TRINITY_DN117_c0_g1_i4:217-1749(+)
MAGSLLLAFQSMEWFFWLMLVIITFIFTDALLEKVCSRRLGKLPPGPPGLPIVGNMFQVGKRPHETFSKLAVKYGPLISLRLGSRFVIVASSPAMAEEILKNQDEVFCGRTIPHALEIHAPYTFSFAQPDSRWRLLRKISIANIFTPAKISSLQPLRQTQISKTLREVLGSATAGKLVEIRLITFSLNANLLANIIFGEELLKPGSAEIESFLRLVHEAAEMMGLFNCTDYFPVLRPLDPQGLKRRGDKVFKRLYHMLEQLILKRLDENLRQQKTHHDLLQVLLDQRNDEFGLPQIQGYLTDMFIAATDTITVTVEWAMAELMRNPQVLSRLQEEMDAIVGKNRLIEEDDTQKLPFLSAVIKEVLRVHPIAPFLLPHRAIRETELGGYRIPKDTQILVNIWAIARDPTLWKDADKFDPQRFMNADIDYKGRHFQLLPFGSGRRICVGMSHANKMLFLVLGSLLHSFDWYGPESTLTQGIDMCERFGIVVEKVVPLRLVAKPRLPLHVYSS